VIHFLKKLSFSENFQQFDFGIEKNLEVYNCSHPPKYNLSNVIAPIAFFYAKNDILADPLVRYYLLYFHVFVNKIINYSILTCQHI